MLDTCLWLSIFRDVYVPGTVGNVSLTSSHVLLYPGLEAKYGGLQVTHHDEHSQGASGMSSSSDAAQPSEPSDSMSNVVESSEDDKASTVSLPHTDGQKGMDDETEERKGHGAAERTEVRQEVKATVRSGRSHSTLSLTDKSYGGRSSATSTATALASDAASKGSECDWAACMEACKGRLNRMLLDCGMPSLPCQV